MYVQLRISSVVVWLDRKQSFTSDTGVMVQIQRQLCCLINWHVATDVCSSLPACGSGVLKSRHSWHCATVAGVMAEQITRLLRLETRDTRRSEWRPKDQNHHMFVYSSVHRCVQHDMNFGVCLGLLLHILMPYVCSAINRI